jgi:integrase
MLSEGQLAPLVQDFYASVLARENELRLLDTAPLAVEAARSKATHWAQVAEQARADLGANNFGSASFLSAALIKKHGLTLKLDDIELRQVNQAMLRASCDVAEALQARFEGDFNFEPRDKLLRLEIARHSAADTAVPGTTGTESKADAADVADDFPNGARCFANIAEEFRTAQLRSGHWEKQTALQARKTYELFEAHCGNRPLSGYVRGDAVGFRDLLVLLPANYGKAAEFRHLRAAEVVAATTGRDVDRLTPRTVQRHLAALSSLWERAVEAGELKENLFSNLKLPKAKKAQEQRGMWTPDKLALLFDTPIWRGCQSQARRSKAGHCVFRDEKFWLPLIALFSGMRQEEICQLHVDDVRQESGVWVFDINNRPPRQVKNRNAVRLVPIHCQLAEMGFLEYVAEQRSASRTSLFHQLNPGGADQRFGHNFTKWFTRYRRDVGLYEKGVDFHSFRHSATTFMQWAEVPVSIIDALTGHATSGETARYTKNFQISQLRQAVDAIDSRIDLSHLKA